MVLRVILYLSIITLGWFLSFNGILNKEVIKKIDKIQMIFIFVLIYIMGLRLGLSKEAVGSMNVIGFKSLIFALGTLFFSGLFVFLSRKIFISKKEIDI